MWQINSKMHSVEVQPELGEEASLEECSGAPLRRSCSKLIEDCPAAGDDAILWTPVVGDPLAAESRFRPWSLSSLEFSTGEG